SMGREAGIAEIDGCGERLVHGGSRNRRAVRAQCAAIVNNARGTPRPRRQGDRPRLPSTNLNREYPTHSATLENCRERDAIVARRSQTKVAFCPPPCRNAVANLRYESFRKGVAMNSAKDGIPHFEIPPELRAMTEKSMEQARVAFNTFMISAQQALSHFE